MPNTVSHASTWLLATCAISLLTVPAAAQSGAIGGQWRSYGGDLGHTKYTPLDQITVENVHDLEVAWTWTSVDEELKARNEVIRDRRAFRSYAYEVTPLMVDGVLYTTTSLGQVAAIDPMR